MSEITPLTKDQLFEKKIAENTGSDYNVGDISDVVPVTKDQSFLKEIALNSAGQSEDITELEEKVTANAEAIEVMVNVTGSCNIAPNNASTTEMSPVTFTVNSDKSVSVSRTGNNTSWRTLVLAENIKLKAGTYILSSGYTGDEQFNVYYELIGTISGSAVSIAKTEYSDIVTFTLQTDITDGKLQIPVRAGNSVFNNVTIYPMLYDARLKPTGYVPYAMTNEQLTENTVNKIKVRTQDVVWDNGLAEINFGDGKDIAILYVYTVLSADGIIFSVNRVSGNSRFRIKRSDNFTGADGVDIVYTENPIYYTV